MQPTPAWIRATTTATIHGMVRANDSGDGGNGTPLANIYVLIWRRDGLYSAWVKTGSDGYYSKSVEDPNHSSFNICANKKDSNNPSYNPNYSTQEICNVYLDSAVSGRVVVNFLLDPTGIITPNTVIISGKITSSATGSPISGIWIYFWRHDGYAFYKQTDSDGRYSAQVDRYQSSDSSKWYNIHSNKDNGDPSHPKNQGYNDIVFNNVVPDQDRTVDFQLTPTGQPIVPRT